MYREDFSVNVNKDMFWMVKERIVQVGNEKFILIFKFLYFIGGEVLGFFLKIVGRFFCENNLGCDLFRDCRDLFCLRIYGI